MYDVNIMVVENPLNSLTIHRQTETDEATGALKDKYKREHILLTEDNCKLTAETDRV